MLSKRPHDEYRAGLLAVNEARAQLLSKEREIKDVHLELGKIELAGKQRAAQLDRASFFDNYIYVFSEGVDGRTVGHCMNTLSIWHHVDPHAQLEIILHSPGGNVLAGLALFDYIRSLSFQGHVVTMKVLGYAASMAGILLQAGDRRIMGQESYILIHEIGGQAVGRIGEIEDTAAFLQKIQDRVVNIFLRRAAGQITRTKFLNSWKRQDWWLSADECLQYGFIDAIE